MKKLIITKGLVIGIILILFISTINVVSSINTDNTKIPTDIPRLKSIGILMGSIKNLSQNNEYYNFEIRHLFIILLIHNVNHCEPFFANLDSSYTFPDGSKTFHLPKNEFHGIITKSYINGMIIQWYV